MTQARNAADLVNSAVLGGNLTIGNTTISATSVASDAFAPNAVFGGFMRNRIINGGMDIWQRGTSFTNPLSTTTYTADRWSCYRGGYTANATITQVTGLTIGTGINRNALRIQRTSGDANTSPLFVTQSLESINSRDLAGQPVTLSFYARAGANFSATQLSAVVVSSTGTDEYLRGTVTGYNAFLNYSTVLTTSFQRYSFTGTYSKFLIFQ